MTKSAEVGSITQALFGELTDEQRRKTGLIGGAPRERQMPTSQSDDALYELPPPRVPAPESMRDLKRADWTQIAKRSVKEISRDRVTSVAGGVTFFSLLALFPAITALVSIYGLVADPASISRHLDRLSAFLPGGALDIIRTQVESITAAPGSALTVAGIVSVLAALWSANGGTKSLLDALNIAWFVEEKRGFVHRTLLSLGFTIGGIVLVLTMFGAVAALPALLNVLPLPASTELWVSIIRWPLLLVMLTVALAVLYRYGPNLEDARFHWISPGAIFATLTLVAASAGFSYYAGNFADYNETYGSLGAVVALMMWLWIATIVVMIGAEINSEVERQMRALKGEAIPASGAGRAA